MFVVISSTKLRRFQWNSYTVSWIHFLQRDANVSHLNWIMSLHYLVKQAILKEVWVVGKVTQRGRSTRRQRAVKSRRIWISNLERSRQTPNMRYHVNERWRRLVQATLGTVDGSHLGGFFVQVEGLCAEGGVLVQGLNWKMLSSGINYI